MKKHTTILLISILMVSLIAGCIADDDISENASESLEAKSSSSGEESQVTTAFIAEKPEDIIFWNPN